jgi:hypothetical protein
MNSYTIAVLILLLFDTVGWQENRQIQLHAMFSEPTSDIPILLSFSFQYNYHTKMFT